MKRTWDILEEICMNWKMCMDLSCPENGLSPGLCLIGPKHTTPQLVPTYTHAHTHKHTYTNIFNVSEQNTIYLKVRYIPTTIPDCPKRPSLVGDVTAACAAPRVPLWRYVAVAVQSLRRLAVAVKM